MRAIGFALVLIGLTTIYLGWKNKIGSALTALVTGEVPTDSNTIGQSILDTVGNIADTGTQQNIQNTIKNDPKLTPAQKKTYSDTLNPFSPSHGGALGG